MKNKINIFILLFTFSFVNLAYSHQWKLDKDDCHYDYIKNWYHCHPWWDYDKIIYSINIKNKTDFAELSYLDKVLKEYSSKLNLINKKLELINRIKPFKVKKLLNQLSSIKIKLENWTKNYIIIEYIENFLIKITNNIVL